MKKVIVVKQHDLSDCGPACLSSIIQYYGGFVPIEMIRLSSKTNQSGTSAYNLVKAADEFGISTKSYKIDDIKALSEEEFPLIAHVRLKNNFEHFVVIYERLDKNLIIMDPSKGKIKIQVEEFNKIFTNIILVLKPREKLVTYKRPEKIAKILKKYLIMHKSMVFKIVVLSLFITLINVLFGYYLKIVAKINDFYGSFGLICYFSVVILILLIIKAIFDYIKNNILFKFNFKVSDSLYSFFIHKLFVLPLNFIKSKTTGEVISRFGELGDINEFVPTIILSSIIDLISLSVALVFSFLISFKLTIIILIMISIYTVATFLLNNPTLEKINENVDSSCSFNEKICDTTKSIVSVKYTHNEKNMERRLNKSKSDYLNNYLSLERYLNITYFIKNLIIELGIFSLYFYGVVLCFSGKMSYVNLFSYILISNYVITPIKEIIDVIPKLLFMKASLYKLGEFSIIEEEKMGNKRFENGDIVIKNLSYAYNDIDYIIKNFSCQIKMKDRVLLKGSSGTGKSTLCNIISGQIPYNRGNIYLGKTELGSIDINDYRKHVTYIGQKDSLLTDTILNNINFERKVSDKEFLNICKICEIDKIVKNRYLNMYTVITDQSSNISGGEKQRIILARGLIQSGSIIILDEALSEVNMDMEKRIIKRIFKCFKDRTIIFVSHKDYGNLFKNTIKL